MKAKKHAPQCMGKINKISLQLTLFFIISSRSSTLAILYFSLSKMNRKKGREIKAN